MTDATPLPSPPPPPPAKERPGQPKPPKRPKMAVMNRGVWEPFRVLKGKPKPSIARAKFTEVSIALEELQDESERVERALVFLREQTVDMEAKLAALNMAKAKATADARAILAELTGEAGAQPKAD